ncbi:MAG: ATP-binding protein [Bacteriovoracaceae bacterium]|nr:ATP-binding protein [Bacteriovoracaceae bacterium]
MNKDVFHSPLQLDFLGGSDGIPRPTKIKKKRVRKKSKPLVAKMNSGTGLKQGRPNSKMTFSNTLVGKSNKVVFDILYDLSGEKLTHQGLIYIVGSHGIGKTHLLNALANSQPVKNRYYLGTCRELYSLFRKAKKNENEATFFLEICEKFDLLFLDDFSHDGIERDWDLFIGDLIDHFSRTEKCIVITSDKSIHALSNISSKTTARLMSGCVIKFGKLDQEHALLLAAKLCELKNLKLSSKLLEFLSISFNHHIHALECAIATLANTWRENVPDDEIGEALKLLRPLGQIVFRDEKVDQLVKKSATLYGVEPVEVFGSSRNKNVVEARHEVMDRLHIKWGYSSLKIARIFGKDHSSVLYALSKRSKSRKKSKRST